jgi:hypothetical protein
MGAEILEGAAMSGTFEEQLVKIPFRFTGDVFRYYLGGPLPELREGTCGEMVVDRAALKNPEDTKRLNEKRRAFFLKKGTLVLVRVKPSDLEDARVRCLLGSETIIIPGSRNYLFAEVILEATLFLQFRGSKPPRLCPCPCSCSKLSIRAQSLNHAYSQLSETFEPTRISHAGSIFVNGFVFHDGAQQWVSLQSARDERLELYEERLSRPNPPKEVTPET